MTTVAIKISELRLFRNKSRLMKKIYHMGMRALTFGCFVACAAASFLLLMALFPESLVINVTNEFQREVFGQYNVEKPYPSGFMSALHEQERNRKFKEKNVLQTMSQNGAEQCEQRLPTVLVVGFPKCGTGTFMKFINIHPDVAVTKPWELHFFDNNYEKGIEWYRQRMPCSLPHQITIEKTPKYSWLTPVSKRVRDMNKNMRLIFVVRDPVQRIISQYARDYDPENPRPLEKIVLFEDGSINSTNGWIKESRYQVHLRRWLRYFPFNQIHLVDGENFAKNPPDELQKAEKFLNLKPYINAEHFTFNSTKGFYCLKKSRTTNCMREEKGRKHPTISKELLQKLYAYYDIQNEVFYAVAKRKFSWNHRIAQRH